jgi:WD40 repeat protein
VATRKLLGEPIKHYGTVRSVAFCPDGRTFLTVDSHDGLARLWDASSAPPIRPIGPTLPHEQPVSIAEFSPNGIIAVTGASDGLSEMGHLSYSVWDATTGKATGRPIEDQSWVHAISPDGRKLIIAKDRTAQLWDAATGQAIGAPLLHPGRVEAASFSPDGKAVLTTSLLLSNAEVKGSETRLWDASTGHARGAPLAHPDWVRAVAFSPDGKAFVTGTSKYVRAKMGDGRDGLVLRGDVRFWDVGTGDPLASTFEHQDEVNVLIFSPDGSRLLASGGQAVQLWDTGASRPVAPALRQPDAGPTTGMFFTLDGTRLLTRSTSAAQLWDAQTGRPLGAPMRLADDDRAIRAFSRDGNTALIGNRDTARLWDLAAGKPIGPLLKHPGRVMAGAFSPNGSRFVTTGGSTAQLWQAPDPAVEGTVERIVLWTQVITGMRLDESGEARVLNATEWQQRRDSLAKLGGPPVP